ncbi:MAG: hypothetical protein ACRD3B_13495 [Candidatus Sulfotelmatobacter sp.]
MAKPELNLEDQSPLKWPEDRPRTRFQDRETRAAWKLSYTDALKGLQRELVLLKATSALVTHNAAAHEDGGVAVWLSRKPTDDYGWQDALGFIGVVPTMKDIDQAYMSRARKVHPDGPTPNRVAFDELTRHRDNARRWVRGERRVEHETVMAVDTFKEVRHNLNAIKLTLAALRQIERCGSPVMMEQAFRGFRPALAAKPSTEDSHVGKAVNS